MERNGIKVGVTNKEGQLGLLFAKGGPREGAGRKKIGETRKVSLTLPEELWEQLDVSCESRGCSRSELIREIMEAWYTADGPGGEE